MSIKSIIEAEIDNFLELASLANLNVKQDFAGADLSETNLGGLDLKKLTLEVLTLGKQV